MNVAELVPLTGGYRKTPVMQLGRDIYCDSKLICRVIDRLQREPPLIPPGAEALTPMVERWVDQTFFFDAVALFFQPQGLAAFGAAFPAVRVAGFFGGVAMNGSVLDRRGAASPFLAAT